MCTTRSTLDGNGRHDEVVGDVLAGEQRQRAQLGDRLAGRVGVDRAHARQAGVQRDQQVEALLLADLADDEPLRPHPQRLLDEPAQAEPRRCPRGWPGGSASTTTSGKRQPDLEDLLAGDHSLARPGSRPPRQLSSVVFPACVPPATMMLRPAATAASRNARGRRVKRAERRPAHRGSARVTTNLRMLTAQSLRVMSGITTCSRLPSGKDRVNERVGQIHPSAGGLQHPLDQVADLIGAQDRGGQLAAAATGNEDPTRLVDPDLLDVAVVEVAAEAGRSRRPRRTPRRADLMRVFETGQRAPDERSS